MMGLRRASRADRTYRTYRTAMFLFAAVCFCFISARPSQAPDPWPQPIVKGTWIVAGEEASAAARERFLSLAGGESAKIVLYADSETGWDDAKKTSKRVFGSSNDGGELEEIAALEEATGVWLEGKSGRAALAKRVSIDAVLKAKNRGAAVAIIGEAMMAQPIEGVALVSSYNDVRKTELLKHLEGTIPKVGIGLPKDAVMVVRDRHVTVSAGHELNLLFAKGVGGPEEVELLPANRRADLIALRRRAIDRTRPAFPPEKFPTPNVPKGTLVIVGGGGMPEGLMAKFIELAGGPDAPIVYIPCEFTEVISAQPGFVRSIRAAGAKNVKWIHTKDRNKSNSDEAILGPLREAKGIFFGGGRQWNLADSYQDTEAHRLMWEVLARGGVIGGSSAGASIQTQYMPRGDPLGNLNIIAKGYEQGLGFLPGVGVDQHFSQRRRQPDMESLIATYPQLLGIGIDETTAIIVKGSTAEVTGRGKVFFYDSAVKEEGKVKPVVLESGTKYDLAGRKVVSGSK